MKKLLTILFALLSVNAFAAYLGTNPVITAKTLLQAPSDYLIVDVRSSKEFSSGHIKGAINIPHQTIIDKLSLLKTDKPIIVYCKSGYRAWKAEQIMMANGINKILHLQGDMNRWQQQQLPLVE